MEFGIFFFSSAEDESVDDKYLLLKKVARFADENGFCSIWTPERHFHEFGGLFPNPSVLSAAIAMITQAVQIRAGSLISPLHNVIRIVEEWSVVDNLSNGRIGVSFGSGWNVDDFVFFPERYATRHAVMYKQIEIAKALWRGESITEINSLEKPVSVRLYPKPIQPDLPVWITSSGNIETFISAGSIGANVLTHLLGQDLSSLAEKIQAYRESRERNGFNPNTGIVSLMLHTFLGSDLEEVRLKVRDPFRRYLHSALKLERRAAAGGGVISGGHKIESEGISARDVGELLDIAFDKYFYSGAIMGTPASCANLVWGLREIGVSEIACLIDFGLDNDSVLEGLHYLNLLRASFSPEAMARKEGEIINKFMEPLDE